VERRTVVTVLSLDVHCHILPSVDEGSRSLEEIVVMARALASLGVERVHATPHQFRFGCLRTTEEVEARVADLQRTLDAHAIPLRVLPGGEHYYGDELLDALQSGDGLLSTEVADGARRTRVLLVELPLEAPVVGVEEVATLAAGRGLLPIMAHPERTASVAADPGRVLPWRAAGWTFQLDLLSLVGGYGRDAQRAARRLLDEGTYHFVGSDLHRARQISSLERAHEEFGERRGTLAVPEWS
jgi:protein-tyrosine phosphatase